jgi:hypothetical protein
MRIVLAALYSSRLLPGAWRRDWAWGLPLIVVTMVIHVFGLGLIHHRVSRVSNKIAVDRHPTARFVVVMSASTLFATVLHGLEAGIWALAYQFLGALPDFGSAILYSLGAMTSYGHENISLELRWQLMGALESLNGWLLFGLTTAFLFGMFDKVWLASRREAEIRGPRTRTELSATGT